MRNYFQLLRLMLAVLTLSLGLAGVTVAQEITGSIVGTVKDANGAGVSGATVTVTDSAKKLVVRTIQTGEDGEFNARDLAVAAYDVTVEAPNFKKHVENNVPVDVGHRRNLDITLEAGKITQGVTVESNPPP